MRRTIRRDQVALGMFIHAFEGSWFRHPFWRARFLLDSQADLDAVRDSSIDTLVIDTEKGIDIGRPAAPIQPAAPFQPQPRPAAAPSPRPTPVPPRNAHDAADAAAAKVVNRSRKVMRDIFDGARLGKALQCASVTAVVADVTEMIEKNRQAFLKVIRLKSKDEYTYLHSVAVCALMVNLARQLGLDAGTIADMGTAGLLHDIGKMVVPTAVLNKPERLTDAEFALIQTHPEKGYLLLEEVDQVPPLALEVCRHHHEKMDGTGYPHGLAGQQISLAARMGAICDVYDALTSNRAYKAAWAPVEAISRMHSWQGHFDPALLFAFMQSVEVFPVGMIVQLRSNRIGIVLDNGRRASRPKVLAFFSTRDNEWITAETVVTGDSLSHDSILAEVDPRAWGIDPQAIDRLMQAEGHMPRSAA